MMICDIGRPPTSPAQPDESGSMMIMILIFICVLGSSIAAVLSLQYAGQKAQREVTGSGSIGLRATTIAGDSAIDEAITKLRQRSTVAVDGGDGKCASKSTLDDDEQAELVADAEKLEDDPDSAAAAAARANTSYLTRVDGEENLRPPVAVVCVTEDGSGADIVAGGKSYGTVLQTLGGSLGKGQSNELRQRSSLVTLPEEVKRLKNPFCDDFSQAVASSNYGCEAGLHIGNGVQNTTVGIVAEGDPDFDGDLIKSNSSIVLNNSSTRRLQIVDPGFLNARRSCARYEAGTTFGGVPNMTNIQQWIITGWKKDTNHQEDEPWEHLRCATDMDGTADGADDEFRASDPMDKFHHELWKSADCEVPLPADQAVDHSHKCGDIAGGDLGEPSHFPKLDDCKGGFVKFVPGWYKDANSIEQFLKSDVCQNATLWFSPTYEGNGREGATGPGVYYMDFATRKSAVDPTVDYTLGPPDSGKMPIGLVGGTPPQEVGDTGLDANGFQAWNAEGCTVDLESPFTVAPDCPEQPRKRMRFQNINTDAASVIFYETENETLTKAMAARAIDGVAAKVKLPKTNDQAKVDLSGPFTRLTNKTDPGTGKPLVYIADGTGNDPLQDGVAVEISYNFPGGTWAKKQLTLSTAGGGSCQINDLPLGEYMPGVLGPLHIDFTNGCTSTVYTSTGIPLTTTKSGAFPAGVSLTSANSWTMRQANASQPAITGMSAELILKAQSGQHRAEIDGVLVDGLEIYVNYSGPPSPDYPNGCDPMANKQGVQLIFGGQSRLDMVQTGLSTPNANNGFNFEICGSPGRTPGASPYGPTLIGLSDHEGASPLCQTGEAPTDYVTCGQVGAPWVKEGNDIVHDTCSISARWTTTSTSCTTLKTYVGADPVSTPLEATTASWPNSTNDPLTVSFKLPTDVIPTYSSIERIEFEIQHAEGADASDGIQNVDISLVGGGTHWDTADATNGTAIKNLMDGHGDRYRCGGGTAGGTGSAWGQALVPATQGVCPDPGSKSGGIPIVNDASKAMKTWRYGAFMDTHGSDATKINENWAYERIITDATHFGDATRLQGATLTYKVTPKNGATGKWAKLGQVNMRIIYRPPGTLRPLSGCLTVKPAYNWDQEMVGTDRDWATGTGGGGIYMTSKDMYAMGCALFASSGSRVRFSGSVYAPTAAIDLTGNDNDASFNGNVLVARHLTISGWSNSVMSALGSSQILSEGHRQATLYAWRTDTNPPRLLAEAEVDIDDAYETGDRVYVTSWKRYE